MSDSKKRDKKLAKARIADDFPRQDNLNDILNLVRDGGVMHGYYQHYTSLGRVLDKISGDWWLTRSDCDRLNDLQEKTKFGCAEVAHRIFQTCFYHGINEDAAMWGLYQSCNPLAIRITIPGLIIKKWIGDILVNPGLHKKAIDKHLMNIGLEADCGRLIHSASFGDIVYLSVDDPLIKSDLKDVRRGYNAYWDGVRCCKPKDIREDIKCDWVTSLVKDREWEHERESRLILQFFEPLPDNVTAIKIHVPKYVVEGMRFTFSPWLKREYETIVEEVLKKQLISEKIDLHKGKPQRFRRSTLCGALNLGNVKIDQDEMMKCMSHLSATLKTKI